MTLDEILAFTERPYLDRARAHPFIKWAGGKRTLIPKIAPLLPDDLGTYWEPFLGGGAVFFALDSRIRRAMLSDVNMELALAYQVVKTRPDELIDLLQAHALRHAEREYYYKVRKAGMSPDAAEVAARFVYLNKTCYNGLYRVNSKGVFNVPRGDYANPTICDAEGLKAASEVLQKATVQFGDFEAKVAPGAGDFVYCDPPYDGTFAGYAKDGFDAAEQKRLRDAALRWHELGAKVVISNADTPLIRNLYDGAPWTLHQVTAPRPINCNGADRGAAAELLIASYA